MNDHRDSRGRRVVWLLTAILFVGSAYFYQDPEWNGNSRLTLTRAIVEHGALEIDDYHEAPGWETGDKAFFEGHYYSDKAIGSSLMAVPFYFVLHGLSTIFGLALESQLIKHVLTTAVMGTTFAVAGLGMYSIARQLTGDMWRAALPTLLISFGTMLWPYSAVFYGHVPAAAFLILCFALLFRAKESPTGGTPASWLWVGTATSMAFLSDHTASVVIAGLGVYALHVVGRLAWGERFRRIVPALLGALVPLLFFFAYNLAVYGKPIAFGYAYEAEDRFQGIMELGVMGIRFPTLGATYHITFDPKFGLFWLSPMLLMAPVGYIVALKNKVRLAEVLLSFYTIAAIFYVNAASFLWYGGSAFGPRLLIPAMPFFIVPLALLPLNWTIPMLILGLVAVGNMLIPLLGQIQFTKLEFKPERGGFYVADQLFQGFSLLYGYGLQQVASLARTGRSPWTLGSALGLPLWFSIMLLGAIQAALIGALRYAAKTAKQTA